MIWKNEEEIVEAMLYWQKRALNAEREVEETLDYVEFLVNEYVDLQKEYFRLEHIVEDSFSDYTKRILEEAAIVTGKQIGRAHV